MRRMGDLPLFKQAFLLRTWARAPGYPQAAQANACGVGMRRLLKHQLYTRTTARRQP